MSREDRDREFEDERKERNKQRDFENFAEEKRRNN